MEFGFSFDAVPTIDMVLYFRRVDEGREMDGVRQRKLKGHKFK